MHWPEFEAADIFRKIALCENLVEVRALRLDDGLRMIATIHRELEALHGLRHAAYERYARLMTLIRERAPELYRRVGASPAPPQAGAGEDGYALAASLNPITVSHSAAAPAPRTASVDSESGRAAPFEAEEGGGPEGGEDSEAEEEQAEAEERKEEKAEREPEEEESEPEEERAEEKEEGREEREEPEAEPEKEENKEEESEAERAEIEKGSEPEEQQEEPEPPEESEAELKEAAGAEGEAEAGGEAEAIAEAQEAEARGDEAVEYAHEEAEEPPEPAGDG